MANLPQFQPLQQPLAAGASLIQSWGYLGAALQTLNDRYGIPTAEKSFIDLRQNRLIWKASSILHCKVLTI
jgi:iron complex outermembrane receptor protein